MLNDYDVRVQPLMDLLAIVNAKLVGPLKICSLAALTEIKRTEVIYFVSAIKHCSLCAFRLASERNTSLQSSSLYSGCVLCITST